MKICSVILIASLFLSGCTRVVDFEEIKKGFAENKSSFQELREMIRVDTDPETCQAVGTDNIGDFWEYDGRWSSNQDYSRKVSLEVVLNKVGISIERYNRYLELLDIVGSERVEYCSKSPSWTRIMVHRSGIAVSGCLTTMNINGDGSIPDSDIQVRYSSEITSVGEGWYINHDCT
jgi:hypothetical protein